jgi:hypothetical protein
MLARLLIGVDFDTDIDHHNGQFLAPWALKGAAIMIGYIGFN